MDDSEDIRRKGMERFEAWIGDRFPAAEIRRVGSGTWSFFKWRVDIVGAEAPLHIGATDGVLLDHRLLEERLMEIDRLGWLESAGQKERWVQINAVGLAEKAPDVW